MKKKVIIIPGNPFSNDLYTRWVDSLSSMHIANFNLIKPPTIDLNNFNLIEHSKRYGPLLEAYLEPETNDKIIIIAHSIGCFFTHQIISKYKSRIEKVIYIFPYLGDENRSGRKLLNTMEFIHSISIFRKIFIGLKPLLDLFNNELKLITSSEASHALALASMESKYFRKKCSEDITFDHDIRTHVFHCDKDDWCTPKTVNRLREYKDLVHVETSHDFVIDLSYVAIINKELKKII